MVLIIGEVSVLFVNSWLPVVVTIFVLKAESSIEAAGNVTDPVTDNPAPAVKRPLVVIVLLVKVWEPSFVTILELKAESAIDAAGKLTNPLIVTFPSTIKLLFMLASLNILLPSTNNRWLSETSPLPIILRETSKNPFTYDWRNMFETFDKSNQLILVYYRNNRYFLEYQIRKCNL